MEDNDIKELHALITDWAGGKWYETKHLLAFLSVTFVGTMVMKGYTEEFFIKTCVRMLGKFKEMKDEFAL